MPPQRATSSSVRNSDTQVNPHKRVISFYRVHGVHLSPNGATNQLVGVCPFCSDTGNHLYVATEEKSRSGGKRTTPGMWECKRCGEYGNEYSFLQLLVKRSLKHGAPLASLSEDRGISEATLRHEKVCRSITTSRWLIPAYNGDGKINNVYHLCTFKGKQQLRSSSAPCQQQLYRANTITDDHDTIWICEGHWDALVWLQVLAHLRPHGKQHVARAKPDFENEMLTTNAVIGVPGATTFKDQWLDLLRGRHVVLLFDNDDGGQAGLRKLIHKLEGTHVLSLRKLVWREGDPNDVRDVLNDKKHRYLRVWEFIQERLSFCRYVGLSGNCQGGGGQVSVGMSGVGSVGYPGGAKPSTPFPTQVFPDECSNLITAGAKSYSCPEDLIGVSILGCLSVCLRGQQKVIKIKEGHTQPPIIYAAVVSPSGSRKTPAFRLVKEPLQTKQSELKTANEFAKKIDPNAPYRKVLTTNATVEGMHRALNDNPRGLLYAADELTSWVSMFDAYRGGNGADRDFWITGWSGEVIDITRADQERPPIYIEKPFASVCGCIQPKRLDDLVGKNIADGFLPRLLFSYPDRVKVEQVEVKDFENIKEEYNKVVHRLWAANESDEFSMVSLSQKAKPLWHKWTAELYAKINKTDEDTILFSWLNKAEAYTARFALIIHEIHRAAGAHYAEDKIHPDTVQSAIRLFDYFDAHNRSVYNYISTNDKSPFTAVLKWIKRQGGIVTVREMSRSDVGGLETSDECRDVLNSLEREGYGTIVTGAHRKVTFTLNEEET